MYTNLKVSPLHYNYVCDELTTDIKMVKVNDYWLLGGCIYLLVGFQAGPAYLSLVFVPWVDWSNVIKQTVLVQYSFDKCTCKLNVDHLAIGYTQSMKQLDIWNSSHAPHQNLTYKVTINNLQVLIAL